ncbi:MAG: protein tyrosine phosphatase [Microbacterium sp. SCN 70-27]|uniref:tyrosine-protein phosphatase n=1 Tax=unclassified Microbacterium TaxID=2609290 RepID=UPI00086A6EF3|nr:MULTISPECIES: tyrosine-protein phosphatase [unclassified Microbacterium]MBN9224611.1 tyrosine-protein phosphatase [Microbacterium sp.]ODT28949.1 MAG: protein tyrosine phosphatase [Microbacterium sp. SCN 70-27]
MTPSDATQVPGTLNFRDIGGLSAGAARTRSGVLFRSGNLARLTTDGRTVLDALRLRRIIDLRDESELALDPSRIEGLGIEVQHVPLFLGSAASFFDDDISLESMYRGLIDTAPERIVAVVRGVLGAQPTLVHCTVGKDRTGVTIALVLSAVGVDREAVVADYARTEQLLPAERNAQVLRYLRALHPEARHLEDLATRSPAGAMRTLLADLDARFGSPTAYLQAHGITDEELAGLRDVLLVGS